MVEITVSGAVVNVPPANGSDGFYGIVDGVLVGPAPGEFRLARASASSNTCEVQSTVHFPVSDFLVDPTLNLIPRISIASSSILATPWTG